MSDDIVTRLRGSFSCFCFYNKQHGLDRDCLDCEAAETIEILRYDCKWLLHHAELLECGCGTCKSILKMQKGYIDIVRNAVSND